MIQAHQIKPKSPIKTKKRIGRGGKRGTYSGKGLKGQKSRAGASLQPIIRKIIKRYPKKRGYRFKAQESNLAVFNLSFLTNKFSKNQTVSPRSLFAAGALRKIKRRLPQVKILGRGKIDKPLKIENCLISKSAEEKIKKAGGEIINSQP